LHLQKYIEYKSIKKKKRNLVDSEMLEMKEVQSKLEARIFFFRHYFAKHLLLRKLQWQKATVELVLRMLARFFLCCLAKSFN